MKTNMIRRFISVLLPTALLAAGCAEVESPLLEEAETPAAVLATKCVNTVEKADDGTLLLYLELFLRYQLCNVHFHCTYIYELHT